MAVNHSDLLKTLEALQAKTVERSQLAEVLARLDEEIRGLGDRVARLTSGQAPVEEPEGPEPLFAANMSKNDAVLAYLHHLKRTGAKFDGTKAADVLYHGMDPKTGYRNVYAILAYLKKTNRVDADLTPKTEAPSAPVLMSNGELILESR